MLEPENAACEQCGQLGDKIGEEVSEQVDLIPARLIVRRTVRIKRACQCRMRRGGDCALTRQPDSRQPPGTGTWPCSSFFPNTTITWLSTPWRRIFRERHQMIIPRQQMVQWIEHVAGLLRLIVQRMWERMKEGDYLQIDESPVRVLDPEVKGKAAKGYLWFFAVPKGDVILVFDQGRSHEVAGPTVARFSGTLSER